MSPINDDLVRELRAAGLKVRGVPGWRKRGRPGSFRPRGMLNHHTGSNTQSVSYLRWLALVGRKGLPAPLCQFALTKRGTVWIIAAGRANHAGRTSGAGFTTKGGDGNTDMAGAECMYDGTKPPAVMVDVLVRLNAVWLRHIDQPASHALGHGETSVTGKWDPGAISMTGLRRRVGIVMRRLDAGAKPAPGKLPPKAPAAKPAPLVIKVTAATRKGGTKTVRAYNVPANERLGHVKPGKVARFRNYPWGRVEATRKDGTWRFDLKVRVWGLLWFRTADTKRWVPARVFNRGRG